MKKGLKNSLVCLGLAGVLAGCQSPANWQVPNQRGIITHQVKSQVYDTQSSYFFDKTKIFLGDKEDREGRVEVPVKEQLIDSIQDVTTYTTPIYTENWTAKQVPRDSTQVFLPYVFSGVLTLGVLPVFDIIHAINGQEEKTWMYHLSTDQVQDIIPGTERLVSKVNTSNQTTMDGGTPYTNTRVGPAKNTSIEAIGETFKVNGKVTPTTCLTDNEGILRAKISVSDGYLTSDEAEDYSKKILKETYKPEKLEKIIEGLSFVQEEKRIITFKAGTNKLKVECEVYLPVDNRPRVNDRIKKSLEAHLATNFPLKKIEIEVREMDSRVPIENVSMESKQLSGPTEETIVAEEKKFLGSWLNYESDYRECTIEPKKFLSAIPKEVEFSRKLSGTINKGSVYEIEFIHQGYYAAKEKIDFDSNKNPIPVKMARLPAPVEQREAKKDADKSTVGNSE